MTDWNEVQRKAVEAQRKLAAATREVDGVDNPHELAKLVVADDIPTEKEHAVRAITNAYSYLDATNLNALTTEDN